MIELHPFIITRTLYLTALHVFSLMEFTLDLFTQSCAHLKKLSQTCLIPSPENNQKKKSNNEGVLITLSGSPGGATISPEHQFFGNFQVAIYGLI